MTSKKPSKPGGGSQRNDHPASPARRGRPKNKSTSKPAGAPGQPPVPPPARRGRPRNSVSLTAEIAQLIVGLIQAGAMPKDAAGAAGISLRTFHEWIARGEDRHPTRPNSPKLRRFAKAVRKAQAQARAIAMTEVRKKDPLAWLRNAPTPPGHDPIGERRRNGGEAGVSLEHLGDEELIAEAARVGAVLIASGHLAVPACGSPRCRCEHHRAEKGASRGRRR